MNNTELIGLQYLKNKFPNSDIKKIQNPDFKVDNDYYEVKRVYNKKNIILTQKQLKTFDDLNPFVIFIKNQEIVRIDRWINIKNEFNYTKLREERVRTILSDFMDEAIIYPSVINVGGSLGFIIPNDIVKLLNLRAGDKLIGTIKDVLRKDEYLNEKGEVIND